MYWVLNENEDLEYEYEDQKILYEVQNENEESPKYERQEYKILKLETEERKYGYESVRIDRLKVMSVAYEETKEKTLTEEQIQEEEEKKRREEEERGEKEERGEEVVVKMVSLVEMMIPLPHVLL